MTGKKILIAPLDWGLGHATRCVPIIKHLLEQGNEIILAGEGPIVALLKKEFPTLMTLSLRGYGIGYTKNHQFFFFSMLMQVPKIIRAIVHEHYWLSKQLKKNKIDLVISDNRYGLHSKKVKSILITHQLGIISGKGDRLDSLIQRLLYRQINKFHSCWIPDNEGVDNICGTLSTPTIKPLRYRYIGLLSRLEYKTLNNDSYILVMLSGPEPQRSILEKILVDQLNEIQQKTVFVRGLPSSNMLVSTKFIEIHNHLNKEQLSKAMSEASVVICRSGYSSIMDLIKLKKKAILIPTPGQTEQLHLGIQMQKKGSVVLQSQDAVDLKKGLLECNKLLDLQGNMNFNGFEKALADFGI